MVAQNLIGSRFGRLYVKSHAGIIGKNHHWNCLCDCGKESKSSSTNLKSGRVNSCGCIKTEKQKQKFEKLRAVLIGEKYGRLKVIENKVENGNAMVKCLCDCGNVGWHFQHSVTRGQIVSCGCYIREKHSERMKTQSKTHGMTNTPEYKTWISMRSRCHPETGHPNYGKRGIRVCKRWEKFENFLADMGKRPEGMSLDRIDFNGNYEPSNCRWADKMVQAVNRRTSLTTYNMLCKRIQELEKYVQDLEELLNAIN